MAGPLKIALVLSIFLQVQGQHSPNVTIQVFPGKSFRMRIPNETLVNDDKCSVQTPSSGAVFWNIFNDGDLLTNRVKHFQDPALNQTNQSTECGIVVSEFNNTEDNGTWTLFINRSSEGKSVKKRFLVREADPPTPTKEVVPKQRVTIIEGQNLHLRFVTGVVKNLIECSVNWTNGREVILQPGVVVDPLVEYWGSGFQGEDCGVKATKIGINDTGKWTLQARAVSGEITQGDFDVVVIKPTSYPVANKTIITEKYESLSLSADNSKYCLWKSPNREIEEPSAKPCNIVINSVTKSSEGNWRSTFAIPGQLAEIKKNTLVTVEDVETLHTSIEQSSRVQGGLDLLCKWTSYRYASNMASFCRFIRPDGVAFSLEDGIGNEDYSYFGEGINFKLNVTDCGITIKSPSTQDEGNWQCVIGTSLSELKGSFINVPSKRRVQKLDFNHTTENVTQREDITISGGEKDVLVERGKDVTFGCRATASLNYCWFKHPNGTVLTPSVVKKTTKSSSVSYAGLGLALGDCKITVTEASMEDSGEWTCNMGIQGEADTKVNINVRVSDGNILSKIPQVQVTTSDLAELVCQTVPEGEALAYCRFERPDGTSFGFTTNDDEVLSRYRYSGAGLEKGACGVAIEPVHAEDFGRWECFALHAQRSEEGKASIDLIDGRAMSAGAVFGIVIGCVIAVAIFGGVLFARYRRRRRLSGTELGSLNPPASL